jgi:peptidoglycan/xylan/chitin deacetylase (PgdA/CDA1 family)
MPADRSYWRDDAPTFLAALRQAKAVLAEISGDAPPWFRAPKGQLSDAMMPSLAAEGYRHVLGDVHSNDHDFRWSAPGQRLTEYHVDYNVRATQNGSIVIIHCASNWLPNATEIIDKVIRRLRDEKGIELMMVTELLARAERS